MTNTGPNQVPADALGRTPEDRLFGWAILPANIDGTLQLTLVHTCGPVDTALGATSLSHVAFVALNHRCPGIPGNEGKEAKAGRAAGRAALDHAKTTEPPREQ